jgi:hypothetical protein
LEGVDHGPNIVYLKVGRDQYHKVADNESSAYVVDYLLVF